MSHCKRPWTLQLQGIYLNCTNNEKVINSNLNGNIGVVSHFANFKAYVFLFRGVRV